MKVHLIRKETVEKFIASNARSRKSMANFMNTIAIADWSKITDIGSTFGSYDSICGGKRVVFNIGGNNYRIICGIKFRTNVAFLYIKFIGVHAEYSKLCVAKKGEPGVCEIDQFKSN